MNKIMIRNLPWKLASLAIAAMLWIFVINTQNPIQPHEIRDIPITIKGITELEEMGFVIQNEEELKEKTVRVVVKGKRLQVETLLQNKGMMNVKLDLTPYINTLTTDVDTTERIIAFNVEMSPSLDGISIEDIRPKTVYVTFEKEKVITKRIEYTITGATNNEYMALEPILKAKNIEISGPKTVVEKVHKAFVEINVDNFSEDVLSAKPTIQVVDAEGNALTGLKLSQDTVEVTLPIGKKKVVPLEAQFIGNLPEGYLQSNTIITPKEITVVGKAEVVDALQTIKLEPIRLDNIIQSSTFKVDFILPEGVKYIDNMDDKAVVTIEIQKQNSYEYQVGIEQFALEVIGLKEGLELAILDQSVHLILTGTAEDLLSFNPTNLKAVVDVTELEAGEYAIPIEIEVPSTLKIVNKPIALSVILTSTEEVVQEEGVEELEE